MEFAILLAYLLRYNTPHITANKFSCRGTVENRAFQELKRRAFSQFGFLSQRGRAFGPSLSGDQFTSDK